MDRRGVLALAAARPAALPSMALAVAAGTLHGGRRGHVAVVGEDNARAGRGDAAAAPRWSAAAATAPILQ